MCSITPTVHALDLAHVADVLAAGALDRRDAEQRAVIAAQPDAGWPWRLRRSTMSLLTLPDQHHLGDLDRGGVGHAQAAHELDRHLQALHVGGDVGPAAVHDDRVQADVLEQHHVAREVLAQRRVGHGGAAVLDHHVLPWNSRM
jgi:hypothetical protein